MFLFSKHDVVLIHVQFTCSWANFPDNVKSLRLENAQQHLAIAKVPRHHNQQCEESKLCLSGTRSMMHYSFDYAQQIHYPFSSLLPGPLYFKTPRKCGIFGVSCEAQSSQVNYFIDEADEIGKGANSTISLVHNYIQVHGLK